MQFCGGLQGTEDQLETLFVSTVGFTLSVIFFSFALGSKLKKMQDELHQNRKALEIKSREKALASTIANISHQWKAPLSQTGVLLSKLEQLQEFAPHPDATAIETIHRLNALVQYMAETTDAYQNMFKNENVPTHFYVEETFDKVEILLKEKIKDAEVNLKKEVDAALRHTTYANALLQVLLILCENAITICYIRKVSKPVVTLSARKAFDNLTLEIHDNAGGISFEPPQRVFELGLSNESPHGTGLGLYLCQQIVQTVLKGTVNARNTQTGACFTVVLPDML